MYHIGVSQKEKNIAGLVIGGHLLNYVHPINFRTHNI